MVRIGGESMREINEKNSRSPPPAQNINFWMFDEIYFALLEGGRVLAWSGGAQA
jgi:hypothetical protein